MIEILHGLEVLAVSSAYGAMREFYEPGSGHIWDGHRIPYTDSILVSTKALL